MTKKSKNIFISLLMGLFCLCGIDSGYAEGKVQTLRQRDMERTAGRARIANTTPAVPRPAVLRLWLRMPLSPYRGLRPADIIEIRNRQRQGIQVEVDRWEDLIKYGGLTEEDVDPAWLQNNKVKIGR